MRIFACLEMKVGRVCLAPHVRPTALDKLIRLHPLCVRRVVVPFTRHPVPRAELREAGLDSINLAGAQSNQLRESTLTTNGER
jgi:hypothetical protein